MVTDYDCLHTEESIESVSIELIIQNLMKNVENAKKVLKKVIVLIPEERKCPCAAALKDAIITRPEAIPDKTKKKLDIIIGKYL